MAIHVHVKSSATHVFVDGDRASFENKPIGLRGSTLMLVVRKGEQEVAQFFAEEVAGWSTSTEGDGAQ